jgi:TonB family protein
MIVTKAQTGTDLFFKTNMPRKLFALVIGAKTIAFRTGNRLDENFELRSFPPLLKILDECASDLRQTWNVTEENGSNPRIKTAASGFQGVFRSSDYPDVSMQGDEQGALKIAVLVDESGKVADCSVIKTSGTAALDVQSCALILERAHFSPAVGTNGQPTKSGFVQTITWQISE